MLRLASSRSVDHVRVTRRSYSITRTSQRNQLARLVRAAAVGCLVLPLNFACGSAVCRGEALYQQQNYIEAAEAFERTQGRLATMEPEERIRYGLYRGLTFMALGDWKGAERWLDYAEALQRTQPNLLPVDERQILVRGRRELTQRIRDAWPKPDNETTERVAASAVARDGSTVTR